jgi:hypothetical protein
MKRINPSVNPYINVDILDPSKGCLQGTLWVREAAISGFPWSCPYQLNFNVLEDVIAIDAFSRKGTEPDGGGAC